MTGLISACRPASTLRLAVLIGLATATLTGSLAGPACADDHRNRGRQRHEARWEHRYDNYYRQPDVYYSAPPIVYQPPGYYQQPGASLTFSFPFHR